MSIKADCDVHALHRAEIEALLMAVPLREIEADDLKKITPHYQQRISESRAKFKASGHRFENVPRFDVMADGTKRKRDGAYRYVPYRKLGRDAGELVPRGWNNDGPYQDDSFRLKG